MEAQAKNERLHPVDEAPKLASAATAVQTVRRFDEADLIPRPICTVEESLARLGELRRIINELLQPDVDYGVIPGTDKKSLYLPGAQQLQEIYGLYSEPIVREKTILMPDDPRNPLRPEGPYFLWDYEIHVFSKRTGNRVATGVGSCCSMESKYRLRQGKRKCPACGQETIRQGQPQYGRGQLRGQKHWVCWQKSGECCKSQFALDDKAITEQVVGQITNPDLWDQLNTVQKMAYKRAYNGATVYATRSSGILVPSTGDEDDKDADPGASPDSRGRTGNGGAPTQGTRGRQSKTMVRGKEVFTAGIEGPTIMAIESAIPPFDQGQGKGKALEVLRETYGVEDVLDLKEIAAKDYLAMLREGAATSGDGSGRGGRQGSLIPGDDSDIPDFGD